MVANPKLRCLYVIWAYLECLLFGGLLYGWGSLVFILKEDGVFSELCKGHTEPGTTTATLRSAYYHSVVNSSHSTFVANHFEASKPGVECPERDSRLTLVFTLATLVFCIGCAWMGRINFKYGTRLTRVCALVCFTFGAVLTGFTSHEMPWLIFPGLSLLAVGGMPILVTNTQFSMLFNRGSSTVVSLLSGAFDASSGVMLIVKLLHERGIPLRWSMVVIGCAHLMTLVSTFFFLPKGFISKAAPPPITVEVLVDGQEVDLRKTGHPGLTIPEADPLEVVSCLSNSSGQDSETEPLLVPAQRKENELPSIKSCVLSPVYFLHVLWLSLLQLRFFYFIGSLNTWLNNLFTTKDEVSHYTNVVQYAMMCGVISSPLAGIVYDINKHIFFDSRTELRRDLMPAVMPLILTSMLGMVLSVLVLVNSHSVLFPVFILNTVFRSFMYSIGSAYISVMFPSEYFGILYGLMIVLGGSVGMAQYGLFSWEEASGVTVVNGFLTAVLSASVVHPLYQWISCRRAEAKAHHPR